MTIPTSAIFDPLREQSLSEFTGILKQFFNEMNIEPEFHRLDQDVTAPMTTYAPPRAGVWFVRSSEDSPAAGLVALRSLANRTCELKRLYVLPQERGKGYGRFLLEQTIEFARQKDYYEILSSMRPEQKAAIALYEHVGFHPCARYNDDRRAGIFYSFKISSEVK